MDTIETMTRIDSGAFDEAFGYLYSEKAQEQRARYKNAALQFETLFGAGREIRLFSAPGRTEVGGNHTDHQHGRVLAAGVNLDVIAVASKNDDRIIRIKSEGFPMDVVDLSDLSARDDEPNTAAALIRGVAARLAALGCPLQGAGLDAYVVSNVPGGSGLSSSAAFEVLLGTILNNLFFDGKCTGLDIAAAGQYAEHTFFKKPCGLMDQLTSAAGNLVAINLTEPDQVVLHPVSFDFFSCGHALCMVDSRASHAGLTSEYAAIPQEMKILSGYFDKELLSQVAESEFYAAIPALRSLAGDRAVLRAIHFYQEDKRVPEQVAALEAGDFDKFLRLVRLSGYSSYMYLQNVIPTGAVAHQELGLTLALCEHYLAGRGAYRVHGGGFAGTIQAFVPDAIVPRYKANIETVFGKDTCHVLKIRPDGGRKVL